MTTLLLALTLVVATLTPASAAVITARDSDVTIIGRIEPGDDEVFTDAVTTLTRTVSLVSSGGDLHASVRIAGFVWARSLTTVVGEYAECSSGCAIVWLAGRERRILQGGRIGLHSARMLKDQRRNEAGTAVMIQFLRTLGNVPEAVLSLIEATEPRDIRWITRHEAGEMGLVALESDPPPVEVRRSPAWLWGAQRGYSHQWTNEE